MKLPSVLPEGFLRAMPEEERIRLGKCGLTQEACEYIFRAGEEKKLQGLVVQYLKLHKIYFVRPRMDKKTTTALGTPDFLACIEGKFVAIETKTVKGTLSVQQTMRMAEVCNSGGTYLTVRSLQNLVDCINAIRGTEPDRPEKAPYIGNRYE